MVYDLKFFFSESLIINSVSSHIQKSAVCSYEDNEDEHTIISQELLFALRKKGPQRP